VLVVVTAREEELPDASMLRVDDERALLLARHGPTSVNRFGKPSICGPR
jgi:hypothetical protein